MPPVDDVGRLIVVDFGRESLSQPGAICAKQEIVSDLSASAVPGLSQAERDGTADDRRPGEWQQLGYVLKRVIRRLQGERR